MSVSPITPRRLGSINAIAADRANAAVVLAASASPPRAAGDAIAGRATPKHTTLRDALVTPQTGTKNPAIDTSRRSALVAALLARVTPADRGAAKTAIPAILDAARTAGSTDPNRVGYLLATAQTESDFGANMTERGHSKEWFNATYGCQDGNRPGTDDGFAYRGRGYVQTTHAGRYAEMSRRLGLPEVPAQNHGKPALDAHGKPEMEPALVAHPEKLTEPKLAAQALAIGVFNNLFTHNPKAAIDTTIPAGKKPGDVDFYHARGIVNGIVKHQAQIIASHATTYAQILASYRSALGVSTPK